MSRKKIIIVSLCALILAGAACLLYRPFYYRLYTGDRIKGNISVTVDNEMISLNMADIHGCDKWNVQNWNASVAVKGGDYGRYDVYVDIPEVERSVTVACHQCNWWNVMEFDLEIIVDTQENLVTYYGEYSALEENGHSRSHKIDRTQKLSDDELELSFGL
ncbi:MAG: hypothetical protein K2K57_04630 [Oscillospiraceae bacterium]|nr:hypothetical protein [Oscillospiraceae bacterium]